MLLHKLHFLSRSSATRRSLTGSLFTGPSQDPLVRLHRSESVQPSRRRSSFYASRLATAAAILSSFAKGAVLVSLDPATALYDSAVKGIVDDGGTAGSKSGIPVLGDTEHALGATFNIAFTPVAADLDRATPTAARTVLLIEVGGTSNGIGLYLIDGVPTLLSKQGSSDAAVPASLNDTSLKEIAVQSTIGKLNAGTAYSFSVSWNHLGTLELKVQPDGGSAVVNTRAISGTPGNWSGNDTLSVAKITAVGSVGGLAGSNAANVLGPPFDVNDAANFAGTVSRAIFWNASAVTPPVPTAPAVLGFEATALPGSGLVRLHWRVTEGGAPSATTIVLKSGATVLNTPTALEGFVDVNAAGATSFTLSATNVTGLTEKTSSLAADTAFTAAVRADLPVAWFRFNEGTGSELIADSAENGIPHDGRIFGQPVSGGTGFVDGAATFDGGSGILSDNILDPGNLESGFTIEAVVKRAPGVSGANPVVIAQRGTTGHFLLSSTSDGKILTDLGGGQVKQADGKLNDDAWAHIAVVVDALHTEIRWYLDGVLAGSTADGLNPDGSTFDPNFILEAATDQWIIGLGKALTGNYWKGQIDEIVVYNSVLDDPNGDADHADSRIAAHRNAWWSETTGLLDFSASKATVSAGAAVQLVARTGSDITSVSIDHGVGSVPLVNGTATVTVNPLVTTTYQVTATGPGGSVTRSITVTALQFQAPTIKGFAVTKLGTPGQVRLHWKVSEGEAPNPVTLTFKAGATELHTSTVLQGFADVDAGAATSFTLTAVNSTGTTDSTKSLDAENNFSAAVRADSPVAWFRFNETAGSEIFVDSADNGAPHNGRPNGTPVSGATGPVDGALTLDGASAVVTDLILNPGQLDPGFTVESVVRRDTLAGTANHAIIGQSDLNGTGRVILSVTDEGAVRTSLAQAIRKEADGKLAADTWAHLVIVVDALHTEIRWYLDGQLIGSTLDGTNPDGTTFDPNFVFEASEGAWNIGAQKSLITDLWKGQIDDIAIYNSLLDDPNGNGDKTDSRIAAHRAAWWSETSGVIQLNADTASLSPGGSTALNVKVGPDITSVSIDQGIGNVPLVNGNAVVNVSPSVTTTYTVTFSGPGGTFTRTITVTVVVPSVPLKVISSVIQSGSLVVNFTGTPSTSYAVRGSTTLSGTFADDRGTVTTNASGAGTVTIPVTPGVTRQFFRIEDLP